jgi:PAS domain S-box-containing protein
MNDITKPNQYVMNELLMDLQQGQILFEFSPQPIALTELGSGELIAVNNKFCELTKYPREEIIGRSTTECRFYSEKHRSRFLRELHRSGEVSGLEMDFVASDGSVINSRMFARQVQIDGKNLILTMFHDITDLRQAEEELRKEKAFIENALETLKDAFVVFDLEGKLLRWNTTVNEVTGYSDDEIASMSPTAFFRREDSHLVNDAIAMVIQTGHGAVEAPVLTKQGDVIPYEFSGGLIRDHRENPQCICIIGRNVTDRKQAEEACRLAERELKESEEKYRRLFEMESDAIFLIDKETGRILEVNPAAQALYGYTREELLEFRNVDLSAEPEDTCAATLEERSNVPVRYHRKKDGTVFPVEITASHFTFQGRRVHVAAMRDITFRVDAEKERQQLQAQLIHAQKMEAVGTLAGGIAHDFNNLLQTIQGYAELLVLRKNEKQPDKKELQQIILACNKGSTLTRQLLTVGRKVESQRKPVDFNREVRRICELLKRTFPKMISIQFDPADTLWTVSADPGQVEQVLMNLAVNARDAMPEGGQLILRTENAILDEEFCMMNLGASPGEYVLLTFTDTGHGMDQKTLQHIFEPFYTTKTVGRGTGLGLAMVYGIVKDHNGYILCTSERDKGTTYKIFWPIITQYFEVPDKKEIETPIRGGSETILFVDDEDTIRQLGKDILKSFGYVVLTVADGESALKLFQAEHQPIDLVILDLIMPGMGGRKCLEELIKTEPKAKILVASGCALDKSRKEAFKSGAKEFISKPYDFRKLAQVVRDVLDGD